MFLFSNLVIILKGNTALTGVAQLVGYCPTKKMVTTLIPSQGTCLGCGFNPWLRQTQEATD